MFYTLDDIYCTSPIKAEKRKGSTLTKVEQDKRRAKNKAARKARANNRRK